MQSHTAITRANCSSGAHSPQLPFLVMVDGAETSSHCSSSVVSRFRPESCNNGCEWAVACSAKCASEVLTASVPNICRDESADTPDVTFNRSRPGNSDGNAITA